MICILALTVIDREVGRGVLRLGGTTGFYDKAFQKFDGHSKTHGNFLFAGYRPHRLDEFPAV